MLLRDKIILFSIFVFARVLRRPMPCIAMKLWYEAIPSYLYDLRLLMPPISLRQLQSTAFFVKLLVIVSQVCFRVTTIKNDSIYNLLSDLPWTGAIPVGVVKRCIFLPKLASPILHASMKSLWTSSFDKLSSNCQIAPDLQKVEGQVRTGTTFSTALQRVMPLKSQQQKSLVRGDEEK